MNNGKSKRGLIIIPARGGSKGIKNKNIVNAGGKPLIFYTIKPALEAKRRGLVEDVVVSTDSQRIANVSQKMGVAVPFLRPKNISGDKAKSIEFMLHAIDFFERQGTFFDFMVLLQPTSPLRTYKDIEGSINLFLKNKSDSLVSVFREERVDEAELYFRKNDVGIPVSSNHNKGRRRQDMKELFTRNAAMYIASVKYLKGKQRVISDNPLLFEMPMERSLDIDTKKDLAELRSILAKKI